MQATHSSPLSRECGMGYKDIVILPDGRVSRCEMLIASAATAFALWLPMRLLDQFVFDTTRTLPLIALTFSTSIIGLIVYLFLSFLFRVNEKEKVTGANRTAWLCYVPLRRLRSAVPRSVFGLLASTQLASPQESVSIAVTSAP